MSACIVYTVIWMLIFAAAMWTAHPAYSSEDANAPEWLSKIRKDHPQLNITIGGDALYAVQPFISLLDKRMHFILGVKEDRHKELMRWVESSDGVKEKEIVDKKGITHRYGWVNRAPLNGKADAMKVNFFRYSMVKEVKGEEKVTYRNTWITDFEVTEGNVDTLVKGGRARWKIENECFNTLKNQGYCIGHNYGHGSLNLCFNFYLLTLLAFFFHQLFELTDLLYQTVREKLGSKRHLWETVRSYIKVFLFTTWKGLLEFVLNPNKYIGDIWIP